MIPRPARALFFPFLFCLLLGAVPIAGQTNSPDVSVSGSLSAHTVVEGEVLRFTLTIKNKADAKTNPKAFLENLTLQGLPDGYSLEPGMKVCVLPLVPPQTESCATSKDFEARHRVLEERLAPGQSVTVQGYLEAGSHHKAAAVIMVVAWTAAESGVASSQPANLGETEVRNTWEGFWTILLGAIKLFAIPAVLLLIGWLLNDAQAKRQEAQHKHDQEQALRSETWKQMLLVSHKYAAKCYLPLSLAADRLAANFAALAASGGPKPGKPDPALPKANPNVTFYYMLLCGRRMAKTRKDTGGLYFKDLRGEAVAGQCWKRFRESLFGVDENDAFCVAAFCAIDTIADVETYQAFKKKYEIVGTGVTYNDGDIECAWTLFQERLKTHAAEIPNLVKSLKGFYSALDYESNRPYKYWYDIHDSLVLDSDIQELFRDILGTGGRFTPEQIEDYIAGREDTEEEELE